MYTIAYSTAASEVCKRQEYQQTSIDKGREVPVKKDGHAMDAIRYLVMGMWSKLKNHLPVRDKEEEPEGVIK